MRLRHGSNIHWLLAACFMVLGFWSISNPNEYWPDHELSVNERRTENTCVSDSTMAEPVTTPAIGTSTRTAKSSTAAPRVLTPTPKIHNDTETIDPDKQITIVLCFSSSSELEWNDALLKRLKIDRPSADVRDAANRDATTDEIEVALKSVFANLPHPGNGWSVRIFFVVDTLAARRIDIMLRDTNINNTFWPIPVQIEVFDVMKLVPTMRWVIQRSFAFRDYQTFHAFGQWFRFFLPWIVPPDVAHVVYIDPDVWFVSNLAAIWSERDQSALVQWGHEAKCSGVMMLNLEVMRKTFFDSNLRSGCKFYRNQQGYAANYERVRDGANGDQAVLRRLHNTDRTLFGNISRDYDIAVANGAWKFGNKIAEEYPHAGTLHSNGAGPNNNVPYWENDFYSKRGPRGWNLIHNYVTIPWAWLVHRGTSYANISQFSPHKITIRPSKTLEITDRFYNGIKASFSNEDCLKECKIDRKGIETFGNDGEIVKLASITKGAIIEECDKCLCQGRGGRLDKTKKK